MNLPLAVQTAFLVYGLAIVISFFVAGLIKIMSMAINWHPHSVGPTLLPSVSETSSPETEIPPEIIAVITAAVLSAIGPKTKIHQIGRVRRFGATGHWVVEGRLEIMLSHRFRK